MDPTGRYLVSCDLGMDQIFVYQWGATPGSLVPNDPSYATVPFGSGPRHITFHPNGQFAYAISEIGNTVVVFKWDAAAGVLTQLQVAPTLPAGWEGVSHCADLHVSADGRFLYGSNRGHDSLAIFSVNAATGMLTPMGHHSTLGKIPRNFSFTPDGNFILAANQDSDNIVTLKVDKATGLLSETGIETQVSMPVCVLMAPQG
jgi:6-phosphogluconolactonase